MAKTTLAVILGNRDFFPDRLITEARADVMKLFQEMDIEAVILDESETKLGSVETWSHAKQCAELFRQARDRIEGVLVVLPNFGDEKGVADALKLSGLAVPILVQAYPDDVSQFTVERRRDAFCGKISVCNDLRQYGFAYSLTELHTSHPLSNSFRADLKQFIGVCKVVNGLRNARLGAIGARPNAFNTVWTCLTWPKCSCPRQTAAFSTGAAASITRSAKWRLVSLSSSRPTTRTFAPILNSMAWATGRTISSTGHSTCAASRRHRLWPRPSSTANRC